MHLSLYRRTLSPDSSRTTLRVEKLERRLPLDATGGGSDYAEPEQVPDDTSFAFETLGNLAEQEDSTAAQLSIYLDDADNGFKSGEFTIAGINAVSGSDGDSVGTVDGGSLIAFVANVAGQDGIYVRRMDAFNSPLSETTLVRQFSQSEVSTSADPIHLSVTAFDNGTYIVAWTDSLGVHAQMLDSDDNPIGSQIDLQQATSSAGFNVDSLRLHNDDVLIAWSDFDTNTVRIQTLDHHGNPNGNPVTLFAAPTGEIIADLHLMSHAIGDFAISWLQYDSAIDQQQFAGAFDTDGSVVVQPFEINSSSIVAVSSAISLESGNWAVAGRREATEGDVPLIAVLDDTGDILFEYVIPNPDSFVDAFPSISPIDGGGFSVALHRADSVGVNLFGQRFNENGEPIGDEVQINETVLDEALVSTLTPLADGGFVGYWLGKTLDGNSPAIMSRVIELTKTPLVIEIEDPQELVDPNVHRIELSGVPANVGLSHGFRTSPTSWQLTIDELEELEIWSDGQLPTLSLAAFLSDPTSTSGSLASWGVTLGTNFDDLIDAFASAVAVDGRGGNDTFLVPGLKEDYQASVVDEGEIFALKHLATEVEYLLRDIEYLVFDDVQISSEQLIADSEESLEPPAIAPPVEEDLLDEELPVNEEQETEDPSSNEDLESEEEFIKEELSEDNEEEYEDEEDAVDMTSLLFDEAIEEWAEEAGDSRSMEFMEEAMDDLFVEFELMGDRQPDMDMLQMEEIAEVEDSSDQSEIAEQDADVVEEAEPETEKAEPIAVVEPAVESLVDPFSVPNLAPGIGVLNPPRPAKFFRQSTPIAALTPPASSRPIDIPTPEPIVQMPVGPVEMPFVNPQLAVKTAFDSEQLFEKIDAVGDDVTEDMESVELVAGSAVVLATGFSIAQLAWLLRSSVLLTKLMSSMPIWVSFDPLPILSSNWDRLSVPALDDQESLLDIARAN